MKKKQEEKAKRVVEDIFKDLPQDNHIIESIIKTDSDTNNNESLILEARTKCLSFEAWRAEKGQSVYHVVKSVIPGSKTAQKDLTSTMKKKEFLEEFVTSIVKDFLKTDEKCKEFFKDISKKK